MASGNSSAQILRHSLKVNVHASHKFSMVSVRAIFWNVSSSVAYRTPDMENVLDVTTYAFRVSFALNDHTNF